MLPSSINSTLFPYTTLFRSNFTIDAKSGGCFCEKLPTGSVQHMTVTHVEAPRLLLLQGGLGPLAHLGAAAAMEWTLDEHGDRKSTRLNSSHVAISYAVFCLK